MLMFVIPLNLRAHLHLQVWIERYLDRDDFINPHRGLIKSQLPQGDQLIPRVNSASGIVGLAPCWKKW